MRIDGVGDVMASLAEDPKAGSIGGRLSVVKTELTGLGGGGGGGGGGEGSGRFTNGLLLQLHM